MAPVVPTKRRSLRAKLAARAGSEPHAPRRAPRPDAAPTDDSFLNSKRDKRAVKHASFVSRIEKSSATPKAAAKRRRPSKKLVANLESLADALPDLLAGGETEEGLRQLREGKVRHKSLRSRKGALKRKERVVRGEVERFGVSLARLNAVGAADQNTQMRIEGQEPTNAEQDAAGADPQTQPPPASTSSRWAALRGFISATMEQNPAFVGKQGDK
ncbi:ribosome biogenesis protein SLX9-domain-containing protein [Xylariomycetidae sp. FL0641]|nr:ribosome biogenesis protein SLX9-domain-containing protein [Xylariomycetidae sp. FL0641]